MKNNKTGCECPLAGYCNRHGINKNTHYHKLCQNHSGYFNMWDECRGPGQHNTDCDQERKSEEEVRKSQELVKDKEKGRVEQYACSFCQDQGCTGECRNNNQLPPKKEMAQNLAKAAKDHAMSGFKTVSEEEVQERLKICGDCEHYIPQSSRCQLCGCFTKYKAKLKSGGCPIQKW